MSLGAPLGLLALLGIAPLVAAYFLRRRQKPVRVSALFLWRSPDQRAEAGPRLERFSRELSLALEILAVVAAAAFLADVGCGAGAVQRSLVLVVDGSLSMSARRSDGQTVAEHARREAAKAVARARAERVTVVESGVSPRVLAGPSERASRALSVLEGWRPRGAAHDLGPALVLARELAGPGQRIVVFTDALPEDAGSLPPEVEIHALGEPRENLAFVSAQRMDEGGLAKVTARVANFGAATRAVQVEVTGAQPQRVTVPAGGSALLQVTLRNAEAVTLRLPEDALAEDGEVTLLPSPPRVVGVSLQGLEPAAKSAVERFAKVAPGVALVPAGGALAIGPAGSAAEVTFGAKGRPRTFVGPFFAERGSPVLEDVQLSGVVWTAGENPEGRPLLSAGEAVLLSKDEAGRLHFNLDLARSNVQRTPAWPVLMGNLVRRARERLPGFARREAALGEELPVVAVAGSSQVLRGPGGERPIFGAGPVVLPAPSQPGRYELVRDGEVVDAVEVLPIDARESDLRTRGSGEREATAGSVSPAKAVHERAPWALLALIALLMADFALTAGAGRARSPAT